jgi:endo-1,4-beta-xylanase
MKSTYQNIIQSFIRFSLIVAFILIGWQSSIAQDKFPVYGPVPPQTTTLKGDLIYVQFEGNATGGIVDYWVYLPRGYKESEAKYPVLYHLHGRIATLAHTRLLTKDTVYPMQVPLVYAPHNAEVLNDHEKAVASGIIEPMIIVFPNGYGDTLWVDSATTEKPAETAVIRDLVPHVDKTYRTKADRKHRAVQGFSMGGFGAVLYVGKYPEIFSIAISYDGALHSWHTISGMRQQIADEIFGGSETYFDAHSPWHHLQVSADKVRGRTGIRSVVGRIHEFNEDFQAFLDAHNIPADYVDTPCDHDIGCLLRVEGENSWKFIADYMKD